MNINSKRCLLRVVTAEDIELVFSGLSNPKVITHYGVSYKTIEACQEQMDWFDDLEQNKKGLWWIIEEKESNTFLGMGGFCDWDHQNRKAEIGFWLIPSSWGKGYMQETFPEIIKFGFDKMNLHRIEGFVDANNEKCKKALAKTDFTLEGTMRDCEIKNGEFLSVDIFSLINKV